MACPNEHAIDTDDLEPRSFSFNSPFGACTDCHGLGTRMEVDPELVISDPGATLGEGAIGPWSGAHVADYFIRLLGALGDELGFDLNTPWERLPAKARTSILDGHATKVHVRHTNRYGRKRAYYTSFEGVRPYIERRHREAESDTSRERFEGFMREVPCPACHGARLKPVSMAVTLGGKSIAEVCHLPINETAEFLGTLELSAREKQIAERVLKEIQERLNFLLDVGLDYLSLDRPSGSLSGGEAQRIRLATQIGGASRSAMSARVACSMWSTDGSSASAASAPIGATASRATCHPCARHGRPSRASSASPRSPQSAPPSEPSARTSTSSSSSRARTELERRPRAPRYVEQPVDLPLRQERRVSTTRFGPVGHLRQAPERDGESSALFNRPLEALLTLQDLEPCLSERVGERAERVRVQRRRGNRASSCCEVTRGRCPAQIVAERAELLEQFLAGEKSSREQTRRALSAFHVRSAR